MLYEVTMQNGKCKSFDSHDTNEYYDDSVYESGEPGSFSTIPSVCAGWLSGRWCSVQLLVWRIRFCSYSAIEWKSHGFE